MKSSHTQRGIFLWGFLRNKKTSRRKRDRGGTAKGMGGYVSTNDGAVPDKEAPPVAAPVAAQARPVDAVALARRRLHDFMPILTAAVTADGKSEYKEAFKLYQQALEAMVPTLRDLPESERSIVQQRIVEYMARAEQIKAIISPDLAVSGDSSTPAPGSRPGMPRRFGSGGLPLAGAPASVPSEAAKELTAFEQEILAEVLDSSRGVSWDAIAGLDYAKEQLQEAVIRPSLRPDLYTGLRAPPKGVLLFGPPGTGKTMLAKAVAAESHATFFSMSASTLMSKWVGEGEKRVKALFSVAAKHSPAVIFIDEVDSMLSKRTDGENDASRRLKTEFMVQLDGASADKDNRVFVLAATNRPWEIDDAIIRRLAKRIYIPLPDENTRRKLFELLLKGQQTSLTKAQAGELIRKTDGYSCSDLTELCREAARLGIRRIDNTRLLSMAASEVDPITLKDFEDALRVIRPSVSPESLAHYATWNASTGSLG